MELLDKGHYPLTYFVDGCNSTRYVTSAKFVVKDAYSTADGSAQFTLTLTVADSGATSGRAKLTGTITPTHTDACLNEDNVCVVKVFFADSTYQNLKASREPFKVIKGGYDAAS